MKFGGQVGCRTRTNDFDFVEDPHQDTRIYFSFPSDSSPFKDRAKNCIYHDISKSCGRIVTKLGG